MAPSDMSGELIVSQYQRIHLVQPHAQYHSMVRQHVRSVPPETAPPARLLTCDASSERRCNAQRPSSSRFAASSSSGCSASSEGEEGRGTAGISDRSVPSPHAGEIQRTARFTRTCAKKARVIAAFRSPRIVLENLHANAHRRGVCWPRAAFAGGEERPCERARRDQPKRSSPRSRAGRRGHRRRPSSAMC